LKRPKTQNKISDRTTFFNLIKFVIFVIY